MPRVYELRRGEAAVRRIPECGHGEAAFRRVYEKTDYQAEHLDISQPIEALGAGMDTLKAEAHDVAQSALVQIAQLPRIPEDAKKTIGAFRDQFPDDENLAVAAPEANAHVLASAGIIVLLAKLEDKFADQRTKPEKEEMKDVHSYRMMMQDLQAQIDSAMQSREETSEEKAKSLLMAADARGNLGDTTATRDADMRYLSDLTATCTQKASDFENRLQLRADELEAIAKATEIPSGGAVSGAAEKHLPTLLQMKSSSFV